MASVKWEGGKYHGAGETKAHFRHDEKEQRLAHEHPSNEHIDKGKTPFNYSMNGLSYTEMCEKYDKRIAELVASGKANMKKNTVTCQSLEIPAPADLPKDRQPEWFRRVHELIIDFSGEENVIEGIVHVDEVHEYIDASTGLKRMSMEHLHETVIPTAKDGRLNGKEFSLRKNIKRLNNIIQEMSINEFGISFHTGKGGKSPKSVEQLKQESATLEAAQEMVDSIYLDLESEMKLVRVIEEDELNEQLVSEAYEAHVKLETKQREAEAEFKANIGSRIKAVYERERNADAREAALDKRSMETLSNAEWVSTMTEDFIALEDEVRKRGDAELVRQTQVAKKKLSEGEARLNAERQALRDSQVRKKVDLHAKDKLMENVAGMERKQPNDWQFGS